ncbi:hypothetical protein HG531_001922 [Fusarium graminearum]|nr:hypothetical protein HG531_001922 [Fusarium graminearum]
MPRCRVTYIRVLLDLLDGVLIKRSSIAVEAILAVSTLVDISDPVEMALNLGGSDVRLEGDNVLARNDFVRVNLGSRSSVGEAKEAGRRNSEVLEVNHCEKM